MISLSEFKILEAVGLGNMSALLRGKKKKKEKKFFGHESVAVIHKGKRVTDAHPHKVSMHESAALEETVDAKTEDGRTLEGPKAKVVLLTEGLGNMRDKNYYGPEAVQSMPALFEGAPMMVDHPSYTEERDIPEGRVNKTVGYYKNLRVESMAGKLACVGEVHFDQSPEGLAAYEKAKTAVHYRTEFPGSSREYVGLSVNASGESEPRVMAVEGQDMEVSYVLRFVEARSCDMVTIPARGGKIVALVESITGARMKNEEVRMKTLKRLEAAQTALKEANSEKDLDLRTKKTSEAQREIESLIKEIREAAAKAAEAEAESETEAESEEAGKDMTCAEDADGDDDADADDTSHVITHKVVSKGKAAVAAAGKESYEANRIAIESLVEKMNLKESITKEHITELSKKKFSEARKELDRMRVLSEAAVARVLKHIGEDAPIAHRARESGNQDGNSQADKAYNNAEFDTVTL